MPAEKPNGVDKPTEPALPPPGEPLSSSETVRRTRGPATRLQPGSQAAKKASGHANGSANHAAAADGPVPVRSGFASANPGARRPGFRANGHDHAFTSVPAATDSLLPPEAGSDDASGASVAIAPANAGAGADRSACAEPAESKNGKKRRSSKDGHGPRVPSELREHSPGEGPLPLDPADFVEEIHQRVDLFEIWEELLCSMDDKIKQRAAEKLTEMRYKGAASMAEEPQQIIFDLVRPKRED